MPLKSQAQRRKFAELLMKGEISAEQYERWNRETGAKKLPERVKGKKQAKKKKAKAKTTRKTATRKTRRTTKKKSARGKAK